MDPLTLITTALHHLELDMRTLEGDESRLKVRRHNLEVRRKELMHQREALAAPLSEEV